MGPDQHGIATLAGTLVLGSGEECPDEPFCLPALAEVYGLTFGSFVVTDPGGPATIEALRAGRIDVGVLFTTDPHLRSGDLVLLDDDRRAQPAENVVPIIREDVLAAHGPELGRCLDAVSAVLTTAVVSGLNRQVQLDGVAPHAAAGGFLSAMDPVPPPSAATPAGPPIVVGSADFAESAVLAELYAGALEAAGFAVVRRPDIGNRMAYLPLVRAAEVDLVPEYLGSLLGYLDESVGAISDPVAAHDALRATLSGSGLAALRAAPASTANGIVVTRATATRHRLTVVSDLGRPA